VWVYVVCVGVSCMCEVSYVCLLWVYNLPGFPPHNLCVGGKFYVWG